MAGLTTTRGAGYGSLADRPNRADVATAREAAQKLIANRPNRTDASKNTRLFDRLGLNEQGTATADSAKQGENASRQDRQRRT